VIPRPCSINCYLYLGIALYGFWLFNMNEQITKLNPL
jgi:hypothetical protein